MTALPPAPPRPFRSYLPGQLRGFGFVFAGNLWSLGVYLIYQGSALRDWFLAGFLWIVGAVIVYWLATRIEPVFSPLKALLVTLFFQVQMFAAIALIRVSLADFEIEALNQLSITQMVLAVYILMIPITLLTAFISWVRQSND
ncbi:hypothetical protein SAMN04488518_11375 [Pseudovibrio ascidiaceicola]|uniref:Uncharacterized protein n=1 Tax=Pseudovibrio ascidiaceicola TaxID=285279 RepID=A0A1I4E258_9HYPH|nr:hypothetical protein [Pseudovibrio ascidiaceicola]SFK98657.1 hypothetical protein SAMN04488518_11375 [Pseudovibrio ascidiaceicola]